jgi:hypothetical protein
MPQYDLTEFLKLSSVLNYNLSAASLNRYNVMMYIIGGKALDRGVSKDRQKKGILMDALGYLFRWVIFSAPTIRRDDIWGPWPCCTRCGQRRYLRAIKSG